MSFKNQFLLMLFIFVVGVLVFNPVFAVVGALLTACVAVFALGHSVQDPSERLRGATVASEQYLANLRRRKLFQYEFYPSLNMQIVGRGLRPKGAKCIVLDYAGVILCH